MKKINYIIGGLVSLILLTGGLFTSCKKENTVVVAPPETHFNTASDVVPYYITNSPTSSFDIVVGTTDVASVDRTVTFSITSPTGAQAGTHYSMITTGNTVTIPAGTSTGTIKIHGIFAPYASGARRDTLVLTLAQPSIKVAGFSNTVKIVLQRYCDVSLTALSGPYDNTFDLADGAVIWGPYGTAVSDPTPGTNGNGKSIDTIRIANFWDYGYPLNVVLNWTDPSNFTTTVINGQQIGIDATYGPMFARPRGTGTFSSCDGTFTINFSVYVAAGTFTDQFQTVLER